MPTGSGEACGRGSAAGLPLCRIVWGITHVDPIRHNLFSLNDFSMSVAMIHPISISTFLGMNGTAFSTLCLPSYGADRVAMVANHNTLALRAADPGSGQGTWDSVR